MKALVIEDDSRIMESIGDSLYSLGHSHDWATNQQDATNLLENARYDYVLLDLQIPAKPHRGGADVVFGRNLLVDIRRRDREIPVIVMTGYTAEGFSLSRQLLEDGATDLLAKPFSSSGRSLVEVLAKTLAVRQAGAKLGEKPFEGGELVIFAEHAELCGVKIMEDRGAGIGLAILRELARVDSSGKRRSLSADEIGRAIGTMPAAVIGSIRTIRDNSRKRLAKNAIHCHGCEIIAHDQAGYRLGDGVEMG